MYSEKVTEREREKEGERTFNVFMQVTTVYHP